MNKRTVRILTSFMVILVFVAQLAGCGNNQESNTIQGKDLMSDVKASSQANNSHANNSYTNGGKDYSLEMTNFAIELFQQCNDSKENVLISPFSIIYALAMTGNGGRGATLTQMEETLGGKMEDLNWYLSNFEQNLPSREKYECNIANSIWLKDDSELVVEEEFLQTNADYYNASIYKALFDESTLKDINFWISENTNGLIENMLDNISEDAIMYIINALVFDGEWEEIYTEHQIRDDTFYTQSGEERTIDFMRSEEMIYLKDEKAVGLMKYYVDKKYAFVALLPDEDITVSDYIMSLTGERVKEILEDCTQQPVQASIPKFQVEYSLELSQVLENMGMGDAFDPSKADFSGIGYSAKGNIYIERVLHNTFLSVDEQGTKAGAATIVEMESGSAMMDPPKRVYLDRPFVYMLIECENNVPLFMGTVMDIGEN